MEWSWLNCWLVLAKNLYDFLISVRTPKALFLWKKYEVYPTITLPQRWLRVRRYGVGLHRVLGAQAPWVGCLQAQKQERSRSDASFRAGIRVVSAFCSISEQVIGCAVSLRRAI